MQKEVNALKKQFLLRQSRNSKVFRINTMNDVKGFDRHVERQLNTRDGDRDSAMKRAVLLKSHANSNLELLDIIKSTSYAMMPELNPSLRVEDDTPKLTK